MKTAFISICSKEYLPKYTILYNSLKEHASDCHQILYHIGDVQETFDEKVDITQWFNEAKYDDTLTIICSLRARVVLNAFMKGYSEVVFLGADVEFFSEPFHFINLLSKFSAVVTPHITEPLPEDEKYPSNTGVSITGNINSDVVGFRNVPQVISFLQWQDEIMKTKCVKTPTFLDQSWLNFLPFFVDGVHILKDPSYNCAYYNVEQRNFHKQNEKWCVTKNDNSIPLVCFQYSGFTVNNPEKISIHQNRNIATGVFLEFLQEYSKKLRKVQL